MRQLSFVLVVSLAALVVVMFGCSSRDDGTGAPAREVQTFTAPTLPVPLAKVTGEHLRTALEQGGWTQVSAENGDGSARAEGHKHGRHAKVVVYHRPSLAQQEELWRQTTNMHEDDGAVLGVILEGELDAAMQLTSSLIGRSPSFSIIALRRQLKAAAKRAARSDAGPTSSGDAGASRPGDAAIAEASNEGPVELETKLTVRPQEVFGGRFSFAFPGELRLVAKAMDGYQRHESNKIVDGRFVSVIVHEHGNKAARALAEPRLPRAVKMFIKAQQGTTEHETARTVGAAKLPGYEARFTAKMLGHTRFNDLVMFDVDEFRFVLHIVTTERYMRPSSLDHIAQSVTGGG